MEYVPTLCNISPFFQYFLINSPGLENELGSSGLSLGAFGGAMMLKLFQLGRNRETVKAKRTTNTEVRAMSLARDKGVLRSLLGISHWGSLTARATDVLRYTCLQGGER